MQRHWGMRKEFLFGNLLWALIQMRSWPGSLGMNNKGPSEKFELWFVDSIG
jgi:hypothetical protein